jgi:plasmid maintenance system killer protein
MHLLIRAYCHHHDRSTSMNIHQRVEMIDALLEEAHQKIQALEHASAAKNLTQASSQHLEDTMTILKGERHIWEDACQDLKRVRKMFEDLEESERYRGVSQ